MPTISPPNQYGIESIEVDSKSERLTDYEDDRRIQLFLNVPPWRCECGNTNFGRNKLCADFRCKMPRPADYRKVR
jgi:hypothetical protein